MTRGPLPDRHYMKWSLTEQHLASDMRRLIGMSMEDIAAELGRTPRAVRVAITAFNQK